MRPHTATTLAARARGSIQPSTYGRAVAYRRLSTAPLASRSSVTQSSDASQLQFLRSNFLPQDVLFRTAAVHARQFSSQSALYKDAQKKKPVSEEAAEAQAKAEKTAEEILEEAKAEAKAKKEGAEEEAGEKKEGEEGEEGEQGKKEKKGDKPPPPPHGDKTPWQVFTETLQQEFQASKEWNEGTKQLSGQVSDFNNDPRVKAAREASEAAKTKTAAALKATASAVGQGAAWTWDTMPVKGVRAAARVTGTGLDYATRPVRQTKAFQAVKETIDDGSSSRYGGWVEKEERRKRRELRELNELKRTGGRPTGPMEEDIESVFPPKTPKTVLTK
jgi:import inner membrane translocase subunit TIM44